MDLTLFLGDETTTTPTDTVSIEWGQLEDMLRTMTIVGPKGSAGYVVAGLVKTKRCEANTGPASCTVVDYEPPGAADWDRWPAAFVAHSTASHTPGCERWRVFLRNAENGISPEEYKRYRTALEPLLPAGSKIRGRSQPAFLPTREDTEYRRGGEGVVDHLKLLESHQQAAKTHSTVITSRAVNPASEPTQEVFDKWVATIVSIWPETNRHDASFALGGLLARGSWSNDTCLRFAEAVLEQTGSNVYDGMTCVELSLDNFADGVPVFGLTELAKLCSPETDDGFAKARISMILEDLRAVTAPIAPPQELAPVVAVERGALEPLIPSLAPFPLEVLPPALRDMAAGLREEHRAPLEVPCMMVLAAAHAALQRRFVVRPEGNWVEELASYSAIVLEPGASKSPILRAVMSPILDLEKSEKENTREAVIRYETERKVLEAKIAHIEKETQRSHADDELGKAPDFNFEMSSAARLVTAKMQLEKMKEHPVLEPCFIVQQATPESLVQKLKDHRRLACLTAEGADIFGSMLGLYNEKADLGSVWLSAHDGESVSNLTLGRGHVNAERPVLTIAVATQPSVLSKIMGNEQLRGRGMLARFAWVVPIPGGKRWATGEVPSPVSTEVMQAYAEAMRRLWTLTKGNGDAPIELKFSPEATAVSVRLRDEIEGNIQPGEDWCDIRDWASKLRGKVVRIAAVLHLAWGYGAQEPVSAATVELAVQVGRFLASHALNAFGELGGHVLANDVLTFLRNSKLQGAARRDIQRRFKKRFKDVEHVQSTLDLLVSRGEIIIREPNAKNSIWVSLAGGITGL